MSDQAPTSRLSPVIAGVLATNVLAFLALVLAEGDFSISARTIAQYGGLLPLEWMDGEYWRFLSAGFLHFGLVHLATNGLCLLVWGVPLERMFGASRVLLLYLGSILAGAAASVLLHEGPFVSAGASGGVSGLLGSLLMLRLMGHLALPASFFAINIGLNIAIALFAPSIDWQAHLGGFAGGMILTWLMAPHRSP